MTGYLIDEKISRRLFIMCWLAYTATMIGRNSFSSALVYIVNDGVFSKANAGLISSLFFAFYCGGQFLSGFLGDRISSFKMIMFGLVMTACANIVMSVSHNYIIMLVVWSLNGLAQSAIWSPILRILSCVLAKEHRQKACLYISTTFSVGAILSYLISIIILRYNKWNVIFSASAYILFAIAALWLIISLMASKALVPNAENETITEISMQGNGKEDFNKVLFSTGIIFMLIPVMIKCMLDVGIKTWVPTMMMETYTVTPLFSTFLAMLLPIVNLTGAYIATYVQNKYVKDEVKTSALFFCFCLPPLCLLLLIGKINIFVSVAMLSIITTLVTGVNQMMVVLIPTRFAKYGKTSTVSGLLNGMAMIGSIISNYSYGYLSEIFGWKSTILSWVFLAVIAILFCFLAFEKWNAFLRKNA